MDSDYGELRGVKIGLDKSAGLCDTLYMENAMNFRQQAENYMSEIATRTRPNTVHVYRSLLDARILPAIGGENLANVGNKTAKLLVGRLAEAQLSPATINLAVTLVKQIVKSAVDEEGNQLYPRTWNPDFIKAPKVDPDTQKTPITTPQTLQNALQTTNGEEKALVAILGSTGLRIGEALAIGRGNVWDPIQGTITVSGTLVMGTFQSAPKTKAGKRIVDLHPEVNMLLKALYPSEDARKGTLFPDSESTYRRKFRALNIHGFHSMRRFRITHLQGQSVPQMLVKFWAGHAAADVTEGYTKMGSQIVERKNWSERAGLGFSL